MTQVIQEIASLAYQVVRDSALPQKFDMKRKNKKSSKYKDSEDEDEEVFDSVEKIGTNNGIVLKTGDLIRMGRVIYRVQESSIDRKKEMLKRI